MANLLHGSMPIQQMVDFVVRMLSLMEILSFYIFLKIFSILQFVLATMKLHNLICATMQVYQASHLKLLYNILQMKR